ncbi:MAG: outer membrane lipoprotein carrier protein LolA [Nitrosomonadaceae bacterium]|nr:outer membrane lipoprotein carrier protein LolA [Nitrosomonadaceae bacterium]|tara:strand:- start:190 stop:813 length:624 start_codon:yes stop_codon:yes gene_type:complete
MHSYQRIIYFLYLLALPCLVQADAISSLESFIKDVHKSRAVFSQVVLNKNAEIIQEASGTMQFERPKKFRWSYEVPYKQLIIGDGTTVWFYDIDLNQVTTRKLDIALRSNPAALLTSKSTIESNFNLNEINSQGGLEWVEAKPKIKEGSFKSLRLGFTPVGSLRKIILYDNFEQTTVIIFSEIERNPNLEPEIFKFTPPKNSDVISD